MHRLDSVAFSLLTLNILKVTLGFFLFSLAALLLGLGLHKAAQARDRRARAALSERWSGLMDNPHAEGIDVPKVQSLGDATALAYALRAHQHRPWAQQLVERSGAAQALTQLLHSGDWGTRYASAALAQDLQCTSMLDALVEHSAEEDNWRVASICVQAAASLLRAPQQFGVVRDALARLPEVSANFIESVLRLAIESLRTHGDAQTLHDTLRAAIDSASGMQLSPLLVAIGKCELPQLADAIVARARADGSAPARIAALRALGAMNLRDALVLESLRSEEDTVRIAALRNCAVYGTQTLDELTQAMRSRNFDVRYAAAAALRGLGQPGHDALRRIEHDPADRYAANMAAFALAQA